MAEQETYTFGRFRLDAGRRELTAEGAPVDIGVRALDVLITLVRRAGGLLTKDDLAEAVWGGVTEDNTIAAQVAAARRALAPEGSTLILTVPGRGYRFVGELVVGSPSASAQDHADPPPEVPKRRMLSIAAVGVAAGVLVAGGVGVAFWTGRPEPITVERIDKLVSSPAIGLYPALSPAGDLIAYSGSVEDGAPRHIYLRNTSSGEPFAFTSDRSADLSPVWSPAGDRIAFVRVQPGRPCTLLIKPVPNGAETVAGHCRFDEQDEIGWAGPDGLLLAERGDTSTPRRIYRFEIGSSQKIALTDPSPSIVGDSHPRLSPDGRWLAFIRNADNRFAVWVRPLTGGPERRLTVPGPFLDGLDWAKDGKSLFVASQASGGSAIRLISVATGTSINVATEGDEYARLSAGRGVLAVEHYRRTFAVVPADETPGRALSPDEIGAGAASEIVAGPDGLLAAVVWREGREELWLKRTGQPWRPFAPAEGMSASGLAVSPDARTIAFVGNGPKGTGLYVAPISGGEAKRVFARAFDELTAGGWSTDGHTLYYAVLDPTGWRIWRIDVAGRTAPVPVTDFGWCSVRSTPLGLFGTRTDAPGVWRLDAGSPGQVTKWPKAGECYAWTVGTDLIVAKTSKALNTAELTVRSLASGEIRTIPAPHMVGLAASSPIAVVPKTGEVVYLRRWADAEIELLHLSR